MPDIEPIDYLDEYVRAALWTGLCYESENDDNPEPLDHWVPVADVPEDVRSILLGDLENFSELVDQTCPEAFDRMEPAQMAYDFHLTRNRHGAGFWDRGLGDLGETLTELAHSFGELELMGHRVQQDDGEVTVDVWVS